ncbi:hypothetical protein HMPREF1141_2172 [Clostridium sp. MSTE9]|nr:hypothetical protein HMPREF1141_2172 [Clostridium sp. MSTE9]
MFWRKCFREHFAHRLYSGLQLAKEHAANAVSKLNKEFCGCAAF